MGRSLEWCHLCRRHELPEQAVFTVGARYHMTFGHTVWLTVAGTQGPAQAPQRLRVCKRSWAESVSVRQHPADGFRQVFGHELGHVAISAHAAHVVFIGRPRER